MEPVRNIKCNRCRSYRTEEDFLKEGRKMKTCALCRQRGRESRLKNLCEHQRQKNHCKDCEGTSICEHKRFRFHCKDCGGSEILNIKKQKSKCKDCSCPKKVTIIKWIFNSRRCDKKIIYMTLIISLINAFSKG